MAWWNLSRRKTSLEAETDSELRFHVNELTREKIAAGLTPEQARREALLEFGGSEQVKEEVRDVHRIATVENTFANLKSGIQLLRKSPSFSAAAIVTLALAIGANSAVFSAINAILLRPLPFPNSGELMMLLQSDRKAASEPSAVAANRLEDWHRLDGAFQAISGWYTEDVSEVSGVLPERVKEALVAPRFLQVWGVAPALGRDFAPLEEHFGGPRAVLISDRFWRRRFLGDPNVSEKSFV
jgi:putative ABC transport system permease protein